jgi:ABC-type sugar transport system ATPase subunit
MVFQSYALWPHMTVREAVDRGRRRARRHEAPARPLPGTAQRWAAAARRAFARPRRPAEPRALRRAALEPRRPAS